MFVGADQLVDSRHFGPSSATFIRAGEDGRRGQPVDDGSGRRSATAGDQRAVKGMAA